MVRIHSNKRLIEYAHTGFQKHVQKELMGIYREFNKRDKPRDEIKKGVKNALSSLMISSFDGFISDMECGLDKGCFYLNKRGEFSVLLPDGFRGEARKTMEGKGYSVHEIDGFFASLKEYTSELTKYCNETSEELTDFIINEAPEKKVEQRIHEMSKDYGHHLQKALFATLSITLLAAVITSIALLTASGVLPLATLIGVCTSSTFFLMYKGEGIVEGLKSPAKMVELSREIADTNRYLDKVKAFIKTDDSIDEKDRPALMEVFKLSALNKSDKIEKIASVLADGLDFLEKEQQSSKSYDPALARG